MRLSPRYFATENLDPRLRAGLVGHWIGGGSGNTWFDRSGYSRHAAFVGAPVWTLGRDGQRPALAFDGVAAIANAGTVPQLDNAAQATMALLGYRATTGDAIAANIQTGSTNWFEISIRSDGNGYFVAANGGVNYCLKAISLVGWHHYAFVFDGTLTGNSRVQPYVDGVALSGLTYAGPFPSTLGSGGTMRLGAIQAVAFGKATLDDVRLYNRALSAAEVALLARPDYSPIIQPREGIRR